MALGRVKEETVLRRYACRHQISRKVECRRWKIIRFDRRWLEFPRSELVEEATAGPKCRRDLSDARQNRSDPFSTRSVLMRRSAILASIAAGMLISSCVAADAQQPTQRVQVGVLECRGGASVGFIVGSVTNLGCVLRVDGRPEDRYIAVIQKVGLDIGITEQTALAWNVFAPVARLAQGDLAGTYAGADAGASVGLGVGGNVLVGGSNNSIALQPLSVQGEVGLAVAAGLESLELRPGR